MDIEINENYLHVSYILPIWWLAIWLNKCFYLSFLIQYEMYYVQWYIELPLNHDSQKEYDFKISILPIKINIDQP